MGIALFTASSVFAPLQALAGWLVTDFVGMRPRGSHTEQAAARAPVSLAPHQGPVVRAARGSVPVARPVAVAARRPLRVLRVVENTPSAGAGRMRISGRMADVCAELDRLAAREAAQHCGG